MSTLSTTNIKHASSASNNLVLDSSGNMTGAGTLSMSSSFLRNRIINGDMRIDQRNAGASITPVNLQYSVDRFGCELSQASKYSVQQNAGAVTPPAGFTNYLGATSLSAYSSLSTDSFTLFQRIEGYNVSDLAWGTADAQTVTLSFWVRSSLTGTFGGSLRNSAANRSYVFSYAISAANTWERKSVTVTGDTTGTWLTTDGTGINVFFDIGSGSNLKTTAGAWSAGNFKGVTGGVSVVATNGATFYLTGVQLEVGSVATPFERRLYPQEFAFCQRYFQKSYPIGNAPGNTDGTGLVGGTAMNNGTNSVGNNGMPVAFRTAMRASTTITLYAPYSGTAGSISIAKAATPRADYTATASNASENGFIVASSASGSGGTAGTATELLFQYTASAEL